MDAGVSPGYISSDGESALTRAIQNSKDATPDDRRQIHEVIELIRKSPEVTEITKQDFRGLVHWVCEALDIDIARIILEKGMDVEKLDKAGHPGPYFMIGRGLNEDRVVEMLELLHTRAGGKTFNINATWDEGQERKSLLSVAVRNGTPQTKVVKWLLAHGANLGLGIEKSQMGLSAAGGKRVRDLFRDRCIEADYVEELAMFDEMDRREKERGRR
jgi:hypothetical protein